VSIVDGFGYEPRSQGIGVIAAVLGGLALVGLARRAPGGRSAVLET